MENPKNELKISAQTSLRNALKFIWHQLVKDATAKYVILRGSGLAISNVVALAELARHRIKDLY